MGAPHPLDVWDTWSEFRVLERDPTDEWLNLSDPRDGWIVWDAVDDTGTRYWGFPSTSGGSDTWLITTLSIVPAVRTGARRLHLVASYAGLTSEAEIDLTAMRRPRPVAHVATQILPPLDAPGAQRRPARERTDRGRPQGPCIARASRRRRRGVAGEARTRQSAH